MVYVKYVIREMFQKTYVIRDLNENRLVIRDRDPPPLYHPVKTQGNATEVSLWRHELLNCAITKEHVFSNGGHILRDFGAKKY